MLKSLLSLTLLFSFTINAKEILWYSEKGFQKEILMTNGLEVKRSFNFLSGKVLVIETKDNKSLQKLILLKKENDIIEENDFVEIQALGEAYSLNTKSKSFHNLQWGLENNGNNEPVRLNRRSPVPGVVGSDVNAINAWKLETGKKEIVVAVVDTGVDYNHTNLKNNIWINELELNGKAGIDDDGNGFVDDIKGWDFVNGNNDPMDDKGHGTHVAGIVGAQHINTGIRGVVDNVKIMSIKFLDKKGRGTMEQTIQAMEYAVAMKPDIINASWGSSRESELIKKLIIKAQNQGTYIVAAAGNLRGRNNDVSPTYPASYPFPNIIAVSSHNAQNYHSAFSTWGPKSVHLAAPGTNIVSTFPKGKYKVWSGTSMAAPHVAGAVAMLLSYQGRNVGDIKQRLMDTSIKVDAFRGKNLSSGRLDLVRFLKNESH